MHIQIQKFIENNKDTLYDILKDLCLIPAPSVCIGLYEGGGVHTREEWLVKDSPLKGLELALRIGMNLLSK